ncbi:MAG: hypothetical protein V1888_00255 [archaeon]
MKIASKVAVLSIPGIALIVEKKARYLEGEIEIYLREIKEMFPDQEKDNKMKKVEDLAVLYKELTGNYYMIKNYR